MSCSKRKSLESKNLRNYVSCLIMYHLLGRFPPDALLEFFEYEQRECPQHEVEATWSIGALEDIVMPDWRSIMGEKRSSRNKNV